MPNSASQADEVRAAIATPSLCGPQTVSVLQSLLSTTSIKPRIDLGAQSKVSKSRKASVKEPRPTPTRSTRATGTTSKGCRSAALVPLHTEEQDALQPSEKHKLSLEIVNSTLKVLTDALKSQQQTQPQKSKPKDHLVSISQHAHKPSSCHNPSSSPRDSCKPPRDPLAELHNSSSPAHRTSTHLSVANPEPAPAMNAVAECSRIAFSYLRSSVSVKPLPPLQIESGMLALIGKLVLHGLDNLAVKELRISKRCLERHGCIDVSRVSQREEPRDPDKETLVALLHVECKSPSNALLALVVIHQTNVLKLILKARQVALIEAMPDYLDTSNPLSPAAVILDSANLSGDNTKAAKQLESLARSILDLCPGSTTSSTSTNAKPCVSPQAAFRLQITALIIRKQCWRLAGHFPDMERELFEPLSRLLATYRVRSTLDANQKYTFVRSNVVSLIPLEETLSTVAPLGSSVVSTYRSLSTFAQSAGSFEDAVKLTKLMDNACMGKESASALRVSCAVRSTSLHIDIGAELETIRDELRHCRLISENMCADAKAHVDALLVELAGLRKLVVRLLTQRQADDATIGRKEVLCETVIFSTKLFKQIVQSTTGGKSIGGAILKIAGPFIGSSILACNILIRSKSQHFDDVCNSLEDCISLAEVAEGRTDLEPPFVSISNTYWLYYHTTTLPGQVPSREALRCLKRSIETLQDRSPLEQELGFLAVKLEKFASLSTTSENPHNACEAMGAALKVHLSSGILQRLSDALDRLPLQASLDSDTSSPTLIRLLTALHKTLLQRDDYEGFYDNGELSANQRAALLEVQASYLERGLAVQTNHVENQLHFRSLMIRLLELYNNGDYPLRRARTCARILTAAKQHPGLFEPMLMNQALEYCPDIETESCDHDLKRFATYLSSSLRMRQIFHNDAPIQSDIHSTLKIWESLIDGSHSWQSLQERIENVDAFIFELRAVAAFLAMRGDTWRYTEALQLLASIYRLQPACDPSMMLQLLAELSLQYLRMGHSGIAESILEHAESYTKQNDLLAPARIQHCLAHVEINLTYNRPDRVRKWSLTIEDILRSDHPSDPRHKSSLQQVQADTALVYSLTSAHSGHHEVALIQAHRSVRLNRRALSTTPKHELAPGPSSDSAVDLENLTKGVEEMSVSNQHPSKQSVGQLNTRPGPALWGVVPSLLRGLNHLSHLYTLLGLKHEATYFSQEAERLADTVGSIQGMNKCAVLQALHMIASDGSISPGCEIVKDLSPSDPSLELVELQAARGDNFARSESWEKASETYDVADALAVRIANRTFNDRIRLLQQCPAEQPTAKNVDPSRMKRSVPSRTGQAPTKVKPVGKIAAARKLTPKPNNTDVVDSTLPVSSLRALIMRQKSLLLIRQGQLAAATTLLQKAESIYPRATHNALQQIAHVRAMISKFAQDTATDFTFNILPESTISYPALSFKPRRKSLTESAHSLSLNPPRHVAPVSPQKGGRGKQQSSHFGNVLHSAQDRIMNVQSVDGPRVALATLYRICGLACKTSILLSAIDTGLAQGMLHPTRAALTIELPRIEATCREISSLQLHKYKGIDQDFAKLGSNWNASDAHIPSLSAVHFQRDFIDLMPESWIAVSLSLSEDCKEMYVTRYQSQQAPFILRLPMVRNKLNDLDDDPADEFGFEAGRAELQDIIKLSNYSCHRVPNPSVSGAKTMWWAEREALDGRMHELLINIENIWLGGFRGILSQHHRQPDLLARFRKTFESILDRHLPSRQGAKGRSKRLTLDSNVLELFVGLGDDKEGAIDLDEQVLDLLYYVIDVLQFNGERNAYDEVDFDSIATEILDALRSYHEAAMPASCGDKHLILVLDKRLHAFPWESLPCLDGTSVSRVGSMLALRERIVAMRRKQPEGSIEDAFTTTRLSGTYIMNPSSDLVNTQAMLEPLLRSLQDREQSIWNGIMNKAPTQGNFISALSETRMLLYFGHGSGNQYVRERDIKKLKQCSEVVWLMGCSSGTVVENGDYEPTSVPLSYLMAGEQNERPEGYESKGTSLDIIENGRKGLCMAVLATLWDVTDKDIDRFSVRVGEEWGLWSTSPQASASQVGQTVPKTPAKRGRAAPKTPAKTPGRSRSRPAIVDGAQGRKKSLVEAVAKAREVCNLRYLNGAATVVYGIPVYLGD